MRTVIMGSIAGSLIFSCAVFAAEQDQWTAGVSDYFPEGTACLYARAGIKKTVAKTATFNFTAKAALINGPYKNRVKIGYTGDGFAVADTNKFYRYADSNRTYRRGLTSIANNTIYVRPYPRYDKFFNWYYVNLISDSSGIPGPLNGRHDNDRLGWVDDGLALDLFRQAALTLGIDTIQWHIAVLNLAGYYNSGGTICVYAYQNWGDVACHEAGHTFHLFTDEYFACSGSDTHEYSELNSTATVNSAKWLPWVGYVDADSRVGQDPGLGCNSGSTAVSYYQGSRYYQSGQYRPTNNSKMDMTSQGTPTSFNAVCREKIIHDIYAIVKPIDTMFDTAGQTTDPDSLWVRVIDPAVLKVDWYVNDALKKANGGSSITKAEIATVPGVYTVRAHVYDEIIRHMDSSNSASPDTLDLVRQDTSKLFQDVQWNVQIVTIAVSFNEMQKEVFRVDVYKNMIVYGLQHPGEVAVDMYRIDGSLLKKIRVRGNAGKNTVMFSAVPAGMYLVSLKCGDGTRMMKMNLIR